MLEQLLWVETMLSSVSKDNKLKFLLDENVKKKLLLLLKSEEYDAISKPKGLDNGELAKFSISEKRIFITNDIDFLKFSKEKIFSVVWLKIPQSKPELLLSSFSKLLQEIKPEDFKGNLITLHEDRFEVSPLL